MVTKAIHLLAKYSFTSFIFIMYVHIDTSSNIHPRFSAGKPSKLINKINGSLKKSVDTLLFISAPAALLGTAQNKDEDILEIKQNEELKPDDMNEDFMRFYKSYKLPENKGVYEEHLQLLKDAHKNKNLLGNNIEDYEVDALIINQDMINAIQLIGIGNIEGAFPLKIERFEDFCRAVSLLYYSTSNAEKDAIKAKFVPSRTKKYLDQEQTVKTLKKQLVNYNKHSIVNRKQIQDLKKEIYKQQNIMKNYIAENKIDMPPQEAIKKIFAIANLQKEYYSTHGLGYPKLLDFIEMLQDSKPENDKAWNKKINDEIFKHLRIKNYKDVSEKMDLVNCQYISDLYTSLFKTSFNVNMKSLVKTIQENPTESIAFAIDNLPHNIMTKNMFEKRGISYERWTKPNEKLVEHVQIDNIPKTESVDIRQVDMYDIKHALCLGNHAQCCTSLNGGIKRWAAPLYILNKACGAIEILDNGKPVGNSIIFIGMIKNKPSLIIDNISLKSKYIDNDQIRDGIVNFAKKLAKELTDKDMPVYAGSVNQKVRFENIYPEKPSNTIYLGKTEQKIYIDSTFVHERCLPCNSSEFLFCLS